MGFVSEVCKTKGEALDRACAVAREIAGKSPVAVQGTKALVDWSRDRSVADGEFLCHGRRRKYEGSDDSCL